MENTGKQRKIREFFLTNISLNNSTSIFVLLFLILFIGLGSYISMPKELFPEISFPTIFVGTPYPGNSPMEIESLVSRPLEKEIQTIKGVKSLKSSSVQDFSSVIVEFNTDVDVEKAKKDVKDAVDKAKKDLPTDLPSDPEVNDIDVSEFPIMNLHLSGDYSIDDLKKYADDLKDDIEDIPELSKVVIKGALEREIQINVDLFKMELSEISFKDIEQAIAQENISLSGGAVKMGTKRRTLRVTGEFKSADEIGKIIVKHEKGNIVYLGDIAEVKDTYKERDSFARLNGYPVVSLDIIKKGGENLLTTTDKINEILRKARIHYLPDDLKITITNDQSDITRSQLANLENSIISGMILVVLVLFFFLGLRNALFVGLAIPLSMFLSFIILSALGITMSMVVLFALILALGMLVDNAIVVVENIYRLYHAKKFLPIDAARQGVGEIAMPIISSTATTLAAFFPLLFWNDIMGKFIRYLPLTLIIVLGSSLFVALVINPVIAKTFIKKGITRNKDKVPKLFKRAILLLLIGTTFYVLSLPSLGTLCMIGLLLIVCNYLFLSRLQVWFQNKALVKLESVYVKSVRFVLKGKRPYWSVGGTFILMIFSIMLYFASKPKIVLFPVNEPKYINIFINTPIGSDITYTDSVTKIIESHLEDILDPYKTVIKSIVANVGKGTAERNLSGGNESTPHKARITISFVKYEQRNGISTSEIMRKISTELPSIPGTSIAVAKNLEGPPVGKPINIEVRGSDFATLVSITDTIKQIVQAANIDGIEDLDIDLDIGKPEIVVEINRIRARRFGISTAQVGNTLRTAVFGKELSKFKVGEDEYPIQLRLKDKYRYNLASLMNQKITFRDPSNGRIAQVPISAVANVYYNSSYGSINRKDLKRVITLSSNVIEGYNATEINDQIKDNLKALNLPEGYEYKFTGGEQENQQKTMNFLSRALLIAIALITLILVSQFNSVTKPVIIVISVLFSTIGVFLGLAVSNMDFVVMMTGIGIVSLAGIVVNNAIVLIDYTELLKTRWRLDNKIESTEKIPKEELKKIIVIAGKTRLRPVLLTAITTILGLIPMALAMNIDFFGMLSDFNPNIYFGGDNANFWGPLASTVIFGLTFATFLTLVIVPVMYYITECLYSWPWANRAVY